jgi:carbamate kinase
MCVADTQGGMGYMIQQCLTNALHELNLAGVVVSVVTQALVDRSDPAFDKPSKPVGEVIPAERAEVLRDQGWQLAEDAHRHGFRRVVASPDPIEIVEADAIRAMVADGVLVVAGGGGGVPVVAGEDGSLTGVAAVVDKDFATALLASDLRADGLLVLTNVEGVSLDYDKPQQRLKRSLTVAEARRYLADGQFPPGSMGPKVEAACRFVEDRGRPAVITSIALAEEAVNAGAGTRVIPQR